MVAFRILHAIPWWGSEEECSTASFVTIQTNFIPYWKIPGEIRDRFQHAERFLIESNWHPRSEHERDDQRYLTSRRTHPAVRPPHPGDDLRELESAGGSAGLFQMRKPAEGRRLQISRRLQCRFFAPRRGGFPGGRGPLIGKPCPGPGARRKVAGNPCLYRHAEECPRGEEGGGSGVRGQDHLL